MANILVSLFKQLDRAFPLQGAVHAPVGQNTAKSDLPQLNKSKFEATMFSPASGLPMVGSTGFDVMGNLPYQLPVEPLSDVLQVGLPTIETTYF